jgi:hypothetical protein
VTWGSATDDHGSEAALENGEVRFMRSSPRAINALTETRVARSDQKPPVKPNEVWSFGNRLQLADKASDLAPLPVDFHRPVKLLEETSKSEANERACGLELPSGSR